MAYRYTCDTCQKLLTDNQFIRVDEPFTAGVAAPRTALTFCNFTCLAPFATKIAAEQAAEQAALAKKQS